MGEVLKPGASERSEAELRADIASYSREKLIEELATARENIDKSAQNVNYSEQRRWIKVLEDRLYELNHK